MPPLKKKRVASQTSAKRKKKVVQPPPVRSPPPETESADKYVAGDNEMDDDEDDQSSLLSSGKDNLEAVVENDLTAPQTHSDEEHERYGVRPTGAHSKVRTTESRSANAVSRLPAGFDEGFMHIRGLLRAESMMNRQKHVADRAGGKIIHETWLKMKEAGEEFFTLEEVTKLMRATTDCKRKAFFWFFGNFLECVCGRRAYGKQKCNDLISVAVEKRGKAKVVTKSDEAFVLLTFENYADKWMALTDNVDADEREIDENEKEDRDDIEESTLARRVGIASREVGDMQVWHNLMNSTSLWRQIGQAMLQR